MVAVIEFDIKLYDASKKKIYSWNKMENGWKTGCYVLKVVKPIYQTQEQFNSTLKFYIRLNRLLRTILLYHLTNITHTYANSKKIQHFLINCSFHENKTKGTKQKEKEYIELLLDPKPVSLVWSWFLCVCRTLVISITALNDAPDS